MHISIAKITDYPFRQGLDILKNQKNSVSRIFSEILALLSNLASSDMYFWLKWPHYYKELGECRSGLQWGIQPMENYCGPQPWPCTSLPHQPPLLNYPDYCYLYILIVFPFDVLNWNKLDSSLIQRWRKWFWIYLLYFGCHCIPPRQLFH